jgi:hypothetical protein
VEQERKMRALWALMQHNNTARASWWAQKQHSGRASAQRKPQQQQQHIPQPAE